MCAKEVKVFKPWRGSAAQKSLNSDLELRLKTNKHMITELHTAGSEGGGSKSQLNLIPRNGEEKGE